MGGICVGHCGYNVRERRDREETGQKKRDTFGEIGGGEDWSGGGNEREECL